MKYSTILQARTGSSRRPGKVTALVAGEELLSFQINRLKCNGITNIIVATTIYKEDDIIEEICKRNDVDLFRGSENNLIERFKGAIDKYDIDVVIRLCGDDPLIDPNCIKCLIEKHKQEPVDFICTSHKYGWIYGTSAELFDAGIILKANSEETTSVEKEHIIPYIRKNASYTKIKLAPNEPKLIRPDIFLTVDYEEDLQLIKEIIEYFNNTNKKYSFTQDDLIKLYDSGLINIKNRHLHNGFDE